MKAADDLVRAFARSMPDRVARATDHWLAFEQGSTEGIGPLRRLLHTIKGEAHMLDLADCAALAEVTETLVDALRRAGRRGELTGDAVLAALEAMVMVSEPAEEPPDLEPLRAELARALAELTAFAAEEGSPPADVVDPAEGAGAPRAPSSSKLPQRAMSPEQVRPVVHELRRLHGEHANLQNRVRETQRMLRALLEELDPKRQGGPLAERITKTLGYGWEIDRMVSAIRAEWSTNDFTVGLTLDELENMVHRASVVSIDRLMTQLKRVGRATARTLGKDIDLKVHGDALLDAAIEQRLEPALLHIVRNAIDHGIEPAPERVMRGKPERGTISVAVTRTDATIQVDVADDGAGVDFERLRRVLSRRVPHAASLRNEDLLPYLFEQGVTTSREVTEISGRGVGLDVAAREMGAVGGQIRIESVEHRGTRFILQMPTALRAELIVPVVCGKQRYALPSGAISTVLKIGQIESTDGGPCIRAETDRGPSLLRLFSLGQLVDRGGVAKIGDPALVVFHGTGHFALAVEGYDNPRAIAVARSEELAFRSPLVRGVAPTPDGGVIQLLDVDVLHAAALGRNGGREPERTPARGQPRALVVEDAPVARELLCGILRSLGLEVEEATDGRQGLALASQRPPDVVLTDLEMPYMDGLQMITELRGAASLARVPVIVLTTATTPANRARLEELGVLAVLSKQKFVENDLRNLIDRALRSKP